LIDPFLVVLDYFLLIRSIKNELPEEQLVKFLARARTAFDVSQDLRILFKTKRIIDQTINQQTTEIFWHQMKLCSNDQ